MKRTIIVAAGLAAALIAMLPATPAWAQNARSWVASNGSGTTCTRAAPCWDFQTAHNATNDGGEINCVDAGDFGDFGYDTLTITKSITIDCGGTFGSHSLANLHVAAAGIVVRLRNLSFQGGGIGSVAINFINGAALYVENCTIYGWQGGANDGILFAPPASVHAKLVVTDSIIEYNGTSSAGGGIIIQPAAGAEADVTIERTKVENNRAGIVASTNGIVQAVVRDSVVSGSTTWGIGAAGPGVSILVENTTVSGNNAGLVAENKAGMLVSHSSIVLNTNGLYVAGGSIYSYKNNNLNRNTHSDGAFTSTLAQQ